MKLLILHLPCPGRAQVGGCSAAHYENVKFDFAGKEIDDAANN